MIISSQNVNGWRYGGSYAMLDFFANQDFLTADGEFVKQGNALTRQGLYRSYTCPVVGTVLSIPTINDLPVTTNSPDVPTAKWTARFRDYRGTARDFWLTFMFSHASSSPQTWATIRLYNILQGRHPEPGAPNIDQVAMMIAQALSDLGASDLFPIAIGTEALVAGVATVLLPAITSGSRIHLTGQDDDVSGALRVSAISPGVSFTITSTNGADSGNVFWSVYKP